MKIGVVLNILDEEYQLSIFNGIKKKAEKNGTEIVCLMLENSPFQAKGFVQKFPLDCGFSVDGIILLTSVFPDNSRIRSKKDIEKLWGDIPVISVGQKVSGVPSIFVQTDDSMKQLVEHLVLKHNYRNFLFIGGGDFQQDAVIREKIFVQTIDAYKPWFPELNYIIRNGSFTEASAVKVMENLFAEGVGKIDAVVCANDNMAIGVYKFFKTRSHKSTIDCAVTGFDDIPQAQFQISPLTTVRQPLSEMGEKSVEMIEALLKERQKKNKTSHESETKKFSAYIESSIIYRESCGCKKKVIESDIEKMEEKLREMQVLYINIENNLRRASYISQDLNQTQAVKEMNNVLRSNLGELGIKNFCILKFSENDEKDSFYIKPIFVFRNGIEKQDFYKNREMNFNQFYKNYLECEKNPIPDLIVKQLYDGASATGCIFFEAKQEVLPYLNSVTLAIAQCIVRISALEERKLRSEYLEREVKKRTFELVEANEKRLKVEAEVLRISELERQRFSNDLHDDICQQLAGISMLCKSYASGAVTPQKEDLSELAHLIGETLQCTRQYAHNSYPVELESLGLKKSILNLCSSFESQTGIPFICEWTLKSEEEILNKEQKLNIFRIVQESFHNAAKHSMASKVVVTAKKSENSFVFSVADDGNGFDADKKKFRDGIGMNSMQYRANQIGADFSIKSKNGEGTSVEVVLPLAIK